MSHQRLKQQHLCGWKMCRREKKKKVLSPLKNFFNLFLCALVIHSWPGHNLSQYCHIFCRGLATLLHFLRSRLLLLKVVKVFLSEVVNEYFWANCNLLFMRVPAPFLLFSCWESHRISQITRTWAGGMKVKDVLRSFPIPCQIWQHHPNSSTAWTNVFSPRKTDSTKMFFCTFLEKPPSTRTSITILGDTRKERSNIQVGFMLR